MDIRTISQKLIRRCGASNPFAIAKALHMKVLYAELDGLLGYHYSERRCHVIVINSALDDIMARYVCAHELGHAILHPDTNVSFVARDIRSIGGIYERQADTFAVYLLANDLELYEGITLQQAAAICGIPTERARYLTGTL